LSLAKNVFVFIGPPGAGKGALSSLCVNKLGWKQVSTGNLCRRHIAQKTEIGKKIDEAIQAGKLVSDQLITSMVEAQFAQMGQEDYTIILDGYPRTIAQAQELSNLLKNKLPDLTLNVVKMDISDQRVIDRLVNRFVCENKDCQAVYSMAKGSNLSPKNDTKCDMCGSNLIRRSDDDLKAILERLKVYHQHEQGLLDFYSSMGQEIKEINAASPLDAVFEDFKYTMGLNKV